MANENKKLGLNKDNPASSCNEIYQHNPTSRGNVGQYWIKTNEGVFEVTCDMQLKCGGIEGGWMQVVDVNMNRDESCPGTWYKVTTPRRLCIGYNKGCNSAHFCVNGFSYQHICGQAKGYQIGTPDAFHGAKSINDVYVDGISITLTPPRTHVWTYAVGYSDSAGSASLNCPCASPKPGYGPPHFVGNDYYCESGLAYSPAYNTYYLSDPLWDGNGCDISSGCCADIGTPWFHKRLPLPETKDFEVSICFDEGRSYEDIAVEKLEIFVF